MRICFFKPNSLREGGGAEHWFIDVSSRLSKKHEIIIAGLNYSWVQRLRSQEILSLLNNNNGTKYYEAPSVKLPRGFPLPHPMYTNFLLNMLNVCDIVYAVVPVAPVEIWIKLFRRALKTKLIAGFHGFLRTDVLLQKLYFPILKEAIKVFDSYHTVNKSIYAWLRRMTDKKIFYVPNGVDTKTFQLCRDPSSSQHFNVIFTGRLVEDKGADILVDIIKYVNDKLELKNIRFIIAGSGSYEQEIRALAQNYKNVVYLGYVNRQALPKVYMEANLFLLPSRTEGFPLSLLEAQSCGLPAVGSNIPGISDVIVEGVTGRLIEPRNVKSFAEAIKDYYLLWLQDPAQYYEMNKAIKNYIVKHYDWSVIIGKLELMFEIVINQ